MRSNLNAWHFLCGGLTLSPQILQRPLVCRWKATNLSVTTSDISPVILPLAFQKQLLHSYLSQQINLCILPDHWLLPELPSPAPPPMPPLHSPATAFRSPLCQHCFALNLLDSRMELNKVYQLLPCGLNSTLSPAVPCKIQKGKNTNNFNAMWRITFQRTL